MSYIKGRPRLRILAKLVVAALVMTFAAALPAAASSGDQCVQIADGSKPAVCFNTFASAIAYATGGAVKLRSTATSVSASELGASSGEAGVVTPNTSYVMAVYYEDK